MVDLVKIRKKAKKKEGERAADGTPDSSTQQGGSTAPSDPAPASETPRGIANAKAPAPEPPAVGVPPAEAREPGGAKREPAPDAPSASKSAPPSNSKLDRFREQAGRLRDAIDSASIANEKGTDTGVLEVLTFVIGNEHYAADIEKIVEIVTPRTVTRVPNADPSILGIVSLRGMMVTIVDATSRLRQQPRAQTSDTRFVVVDHGGETIGFEVDRVLRVIKLDRASVEAHPVIHSSEVDDSVVGVFRHEGTLTILLDFDKLLAATAAGS